MSCLASRAAGFMATESLCPSPFHITRAWEAKHGTRDEEMGQMCLLSLRSGQGMRTEVGGGQRRRSEIQSQTALRADVHRASP